MGYTQMGCILTIYSKHAYKEHLLPAVTNANHHLTLHRELFHLPEDIPLELENVNGRWLFVKTGRFSLTYTDVKEDAFGQPLKNNDIFSLKIPSGEQVTIIVTVTDRFFHVFGKFSLEGVDSVSVGAGEENAIQYDFLHIISKTHAVIMKKGGGYLVEDRSVNGLFVNSRRVTGSKRLEYGDTINIFGLSIVFMDRFLAVDTAGGSTRLKPGTLKPCKPEAAVFPGGGSLARIFHRAPRYLPKLATDTVEIEAPPAAKEQNQDPPLLAIGPAITMALPMLLGCSLTIFSAGSGGGVYLYTGLVTAVSSALIGTAWALVNLNHAKKKLRESELKRFEVYGEYLISCSNQIQEKYNRNASILRQLYVDPEECCKYDSTTTQMWNRNHTHPDFLYQRLGIGQLPFQASVEIPKERFSMLNDTLAAKARMIKETYAVLQDVPVCAALDRKLVGVIGGPRRTGCYPVVHNLVAQIAANNCYTDVKLGFVYQKEKDNGQWAFARWLPHVWSEDKRTRYVADSREAASDVFYELVKVLRMRAEEASGREEAPYKPHYILFIEDVSVLDGELITTFLLDGRTLGVTTILLAESYEELPNACEYIIENTSGFQGVYEVTDPVEDRQRLRMDKAAPLLVESFARRLSQVQVSEIETGGELPASLTFLEMYGVRKLSELNIEDRWRKNRTYDNIQGLLGQKSGGAPCYLDVHEKYHGPHGLIAGTTGSGKSETLQTYILSLAINYSPDDVGFFLIDYKGGGMANLFSSLPHLIGQISNLSGNQVHRAMVSIKSENVRRQRVFNEHGVNNINSYTQLYKSGEAGLPVPHLFIIIDEFAELKREEPDFMKELISVAQVGRSLGVHLILATQKPSGTVDDNIWSNARFRLCLRVQDKQDSKDMLHRTDAAYITQAGRCYLQVGNNELFELFQSGWSGAAYEEDAAQSDIARMLTVTGKAALVGNHTQLQRKSQERLDWIHALLRLLDAAAGGAENIPAHRDDSSLSGLAERFFSLAEEASLDYPQNEYNAQRVKDLILVYAKVLESGTAEDLPQAVMKQAAGSGRKLPEPKEKTQLEAVVEYLAMLAKQGGYVHNFQLWMPVLPEKLYLDQLRGYDQYAFDGTSWPKPGPHWELEAFTGLYDDPVNQAQMPMVVDFANNGSLAVCGTVGSGKSTFLVTLLYSLVNRYTPETLHIYGIDFSSRMLSVFDGLPHAGGLMYETDLDKIDKFFNMLSSMLAERKTRLKGGSYAQMMRAGSRPDHPAMPAVIVVIDNYASFRAKTNFIYDDFMLKLSQEGVGCGIFLAVTAAGFSSNEIPSRMGENLRTVICLEMTDRFAYAETLRNMHLDVLPEENVKGRGLSRYGDNFLEFQTALCLESEDDFSRNQEIQRRCQVLNAHWTGPRARPVPEIPQKPVWRDFARLEAVAAMQAQGRCVPVGYDQRNAAVYGISLQRTYCYIISGRARTGKTNMLRTLLASASCMDASVVLIDFAGEFAAAGDGVRRVSDSQELFQYLLELQEDFINRNQFKLKCLQEGDTDEEIYEKMQDYRKVFLLIGNLVDFARHVEHPEDGVGPMSSFVCNLLDKGANHNVYWFACLNQDEASEVAGLPSYELFIRAKTGIHFGGNVDAQSMMDFDYIRFSDRGKALKPGIGLLSPVDEGAPQRVIVPLCRR